MIQTIVLLSTITTSTNICVSNSNYILLRYSPKRNTFNNVNQPASQFSTAWFVNGDLPNQGDFGFDPTLAAGNYFNRAPFRTDLNGKLGNTATSCDPTKNFCYYYNLFSTNGNVNPAIGTPLTIRKDFNNATQTSCQTRSGLMALAGNDPDVARTILENESNPVLRAQYVIELTHWYQSQSQMDSLLALLSEFGRRQELFRTYMAMDSLALADMVLSDLELSSFTEDKMFAQVNKILLQLRSNGLSIQEMDSSGVALLRWIINENNAMSDQARNILYMIDSVYSPIPIEGDTGMYRIAVNSEAQGDDAFIRLNGNPVKDVLNFELVSIENSSELIFIELIDASGKLVDSRTTVRSIQYAVPLHSLNSGLYLLRIRVDGINVQTNFIKQ